MKPCGAWSRVLIVSSGYNATSTATPATPPQRNDSLVVTVAIGTAAVVVPSDNNPGRKKRRVF
jgi:hypothetical protein